MGVMETLAPFFLPAVLSMKEANRFGVPLYVDVTDRQLKRAGLRAYLAPEKLLAFVLMFALMAAVVASLALVVLGAKLVAIFTFTMTFLFCFVLPGLLLSNTANRRVLMIEKRLPFAIEFMLLGMQANTSFAAAIETYCAQFDKEPLGIEFRKALADIDLGASFVEALERMAGRLESNEITMFVSALITGEKKGQPMQHVLKVQADAARQRRFHRAEQIAKAANANATPFLILAAVGLLILLLGPLVISMNDSSLF
jgi:Flp pilus assembly protein TadB